MNPGQAENIIGAELGLLPVNKCTVKNGPCSCKYIEGHTQHHQCDHGFNWTNEESNMTPTQLNTTAAIAEYLREHPNKRLDLKGAYLRRADLGGADLHEANLRQAYLEGADLRGANLGEANLWGVNLGATQVWQFGPIGSHKDYLIIKSGPNLDEVMTGCFKGTLAEFSAAVTRTHGTNKYAQEYQAVILAVKRLVAVHRDTYSGL